MPRLLDPDLPPTENPYYGVANYPGSGGPQVFVPRSTPPSITIDPGAIPFHYDVGPRPAPPPVAPRPVARRGNPSPYLPPPVQQTAPPPRAGGGSGYFGGALTGRSGVFDVGNLSGLMGVGSLGAGLRLFPQPVHTYFKGGMVHGPKGIDNVNAKLTDGEIVMNPVASKKHKTMLLALNAMTAPRFTSGMGLKHGPSPFDKKI